MAPAHIEPDDIQSLLRRQLDSPVRWADLVRTLARAGATTFIECGPRESVDRARSSHRQAATLPGVAGSGISSGDSGRPWSPKLGRPRDRQDTFDTHSCWTNSFGDGRLSRHRPGHRAATGAVRRQGDRHGHYCRRRDEKSPRHFPPPAAGARYSTSPCPNHWLHCWPVWILQVTCPPS